MTSFTKLRASVTGKDASCDAGAPEWADWTVVAFLFSVEEPMMVSSVGYGTGDRGNPYYSRWLGTREKPQQCSGVDGVVSVLHSRSVVSLLHGMLAQCLPRLSVWLARDGRLLPLSCLSNYIYIYTHIKWLSDSTL